MSNLANTATKKINYQIVQKDKFQCYQRDSDNFVSLSDICMELEVTVNSFFENIFILALEIVARRYDKDLPPSTSEISLSSTFAQYRDLFRILELNGEKQVFVHPEVWEIYQPEDTELQLAISDWQERGHMGLRLESIIKLQHNLYDMGRIVPPNCRAAFFDAGSNDNLLILTGKEYRWQFFVDLMEQSIFLHPELLQNEINILDSMNFTNYTCQRYLGDDIAFPNRKQELCEIKAVKVTPKYNGFRTLEYYYVDEVDEENETAIKTYKICLPPEVDEAISHLLEKTFKLVDPTNVKESLQKLGYKKPELENRFRNNALIEEVEIVEETEAGELTVASELWRTIELGNIEVRQRVSDDFICANDMCRPFDADLRDWLKTDRAWNEFESMARFKQLDFNSYLNTNSEQTRVLEAFPALIERKRGNSFNGGGTWIEPHLAINLAQWLDSDFAVQVTYHLEEYFAIKKVLQMKLTDSTDRLEQIVEQLLERKLA